MVFHMGRYSKNELLTLYVIQNFLEKFYFVLSAMLLIYFFQFWTNYIYKMV